MQKTASQWFRFILNHEKFKVAAKLDVIYPYEDHDTFEKSAGIFKSSSYNKYPAGNIITPLYIHYDYFEKLIKSKDYRAFFVIRDPRDIVVSWYFSTKNSHGKDGFIDKHIDALQKLSLEDGLLYSIKALTDFGLYEAMESWLNNANPENEKIVKFEDFTGSNQLLHWQELLKFLGVSLPHGLMEQLLNEFGFSYWANGRDPGEEEEKSHMRKGVSGDWQNYFTPKISEAFLNCTEYFNLNDSYVHES